MPAALDTDLADDTDLDFGFALMCPPNARPAKRPTECDRTQADFAAEAWKRDQGIVPADPAEAARPRK